MQDYHTFEEEETLIALKLVPKLLIIWIANDVCFMVLFMALDLYSSKLMMGFPIIILLYFVFILIVHSKLMKNVNANKILLNQLPLIFSVFMAGGIAMHSLWFEFIKDEYMRGASLTFIQLLGLSCHSLIRRKVRYTIIQFPLIFFISYYRTYYNVQKVIGLLIIFSGSCTLYYFIINIIETELYDSFKLREALNRLSKKYYDTINALPISMLVADHSFTSIELNESLGQVMKHSHCNSVIELLDKITDDEKHTALEFIKRKHLLESISSANYKLMINKVIIFFNIVIKKLDSQIIVVLNDITDSIILKQEQIFKSFKTSLSCSFSHEIRTPIHQIGCFAYTLTNNEDKMISSIGKLIVTCLKDLSLKIDDISDITEIELGTFVLNPTLFTLKDWLLQIKKQYIKTAKIKGINFEIESDNYQFKINNDKNRLNQIVSNIISNSIKFTQKGKITISANFNNKDCLLELVITDTGNGMPYEKLLAINGITKNRIYSRSKSATELGGMGLVIVHMLCIQMNIKIVFESKLDVGTKVTLIVPSIGTLSSTLSNAGKLRLTYYSSCIIREYKHTYEDQVSDENKETVIIYSQNYHDNLVSTKRSGNQKLQAVSNLILIVDDVEINRLALKFMLAKLNTTIIEANDGISALSMYKQYHTSIRVVLMDLEMPNMNGIESTIEIRKYENSQMIPHTKIIALTAFTEDKFKMQCLEAGMNDFYKKPLRFQEMKEILQQYYYATD